MTAFTPQFVITNKIAEALTQVERARGFLEAATLSEDWVARMSQRALLLEAHYTTHIEGTQLSLAQAEQLWEGQEVPSADPDDHRELLNYRHAFELVGEYLSQGSPITETLIREIQKRLVEGVRGGQGQPGRYRTVQNYVVRGETGEVVYTPPPPGDVPALMQQLTDWLNADTDNHPVLVSGLAQFQLIHIHPFVDGNGRTSRLLATLCLYRSGYDFKRLFTLSEYYDRDRAAFYHAIQSVRENGMNLTLWLEYFTAGLAAQLEEAKARGTRAIKTDLLAKEHGLGDRQRSILVCCAELGGIGISDLTKLLPNVPRRTLQRDLKKLLDAGLLAEAGETHQRRYSINEHEL